MSSPLEYRNKTVNDMSVGTTTTNVGSSHFNRLMIYRCVVVVKFEAFYVSLKK